MYVLFLGIGARPGDQALGSGAFLQSQLVMLRIGLLRPLPAIEEPLEAIRAYSLSARSSGRSRSDNSKRAGSHGNAFLQRLRQSAYKGGRRRHVQ